jgi:U5 small nuclear ribonucleoprotein component
MYVAKVDKLWIMQAGGRYKVGINKMSAGNWIGIEGVDKGIMKTATLVDVDDV